MKFKDFELMALLTIWEPFEEGGQTIGARYICETWDKAKEMGEMLRDYNQKNNKFIKYTIEDHFENIEELILYYND